MIGEVKSLGDLGLFKNGINKAKKDFGHGYPFVTSWMFLASPKILAYNADFGLVNSTPDERKLYELKKVIFCLSDLQ